MASGLPVPGSWLNDAPSLPQERGPAALYIQTATALQSPFFQSSQAHLSGKRLRYPIPEGLPRLGGYPWRAPEPWVQRLL